jgi:hypothetical protein
MPALCTYILHKKSGGIPRSASMMGEKKMGMPKQAILEILEHAPTKALQHLHLPGVNVFVDDPAIRVEEFYGTNGKTDVFVFDAQDPVVNITQLRICCCLKTLPAAISQ